MADFPSANPSGASLTPEQEDAVDSIVNLPDDSIPKAESGSLIPSPAIVDAATDVTAFDASINVPTGSVKFADAYTLSASGASMSIEDGSINRVYRLYVDDIESVKRPQLISNRLETGIFEVFPIDSDELVDPLDTPLTIPAVATALSLGDNEDGQTITFVDLKLTAASVKTNITITLKLNGIVFARFFYPVAVLYEGSDIYRFEYTPPVDVRVGDTLEVTTSSSDGPMIFLGDAVTEQKWQRVDLILWDYNDSITKRDLPNLDSQYNLINTDYTAPTAQTSGVSVIYEPTATSDIASDFLGSIATVGGTSGTCTTIGSNTFSQSDIVLVSGSRFNSGLFEVEDHTGTTLEIRGVDGVANVEDFTNTDFLYELDSAVIAKVNVSAMRAGLDGKWEQGRGSETPLQFTTIDLFGSEYQFESDELESATSEMTFQNKLTLTTAAVPAGTYKGQFTCAVTNNSGNKVVVIEIVLDGVPVNESSYSPKIGDEFLVKTAFTAKSVLSGEHVLELNYKAGATGGVAKIKNARLEVFRVG